MAKSKNTALEPTHIVSIYLDGKLVQEFEAIFDKEELFSDRINLIESGRIDEDSFVDIGDRLFIMTSEEGGDQFDILDIDTHAKEGMVVYGEDECGRSVNVYFKHLQSGKDYWVERIEKGGGDFDLFGDEEDFSLFDDSDDDEEPEYVDYQTFFLNLVGDISSDGQLDEYKFELLRAAFNHISKDEIKFRRKIKGQYWNGEKQEAIVVTRLYIEDDKVECVFKCDIADEKTQEVQSVDFADVKLKKKALLDVMAEVGTKTKGEYTEDDVNWADSLF